MKKYIKRYNIILMRKPSDFPGVNEIVRLNKEQAEMVFEHSLGDIKRIIKQKIAIYEPLEFKLTFKKFILRLKEKEYLIIREIPKNIGLETVWNNLIKDFLIENAYYVLAEKYIQRIVMNKLGSSDPNEIRILEAGDFIREKLEKEGLKKLKSFQEKAKFKTFLVTAVNRLFIDFWRQKSSLEENVTKYGPDFDVLFDPPVDDPLKKLIKLEDEDFNNKAVVVLPLILEQLDYNERLAIKLKYEKDMKLSAVARILGCTRFKAGLFIKQVEWKISQGLSVELKRGGRYETPGR